MFKEDAVCDKSNHPPQIFPQGKAGVTACYNVCKENAKAGTAMFSFSSADKRCVCWGKSENQQCTTASADDDDYKWLYGRNPTLYKY